MTARHAFPAGEIRRLTVDSAALKGNFLGDPDRRDVLVYIPHGHDGKGLPLLVDLAGFTGSGLGRASWRNFGENTPERLDRLIGSGEMPPCAVAMPDCFTRLGGNQYVNSAAMGNWADFLIQDMLPAVESQIGCGGDGKRGVYGKSSGGYGAIVHAMLYPRTWSAAACLSGDMGFELMFAADFAATLRALSRHGGSVQAFMDRFEGNPKPSGGDIHTLMILAMAATYDPDPSQPFGVRLPVDMHTCERIPERWAEWMKWDPLSLVEEHYEALEGMKALWIECGDVDQYNLLYGARRLHQRLNALGVTHAYKEFPDNHNSLDYRLDRSLPYLARALS
jgi:enterochelin esterase-like enzyme